MRIQSNGLPDHCFSSPYPVLSQKFDFEVKFNPSVSGQSLTSYTSQTIYEASACYQTKTATVPTYAGFSATPGQSGLTSTATIAGIAINGVPIGVSAGYNSMNADPLFPKKWTGAKKVSPILVDGCLGSPQPTSGIYNYVMVSPCLVNSGNLTTNDTCAYNTTCQASI